MLKIATERGISLFIILKDNQRGNEGYTRPFGYYDPPHLVLMNM
jgi:hypothetical protein